jgi:hypothetical protein
MSPVLCFLLLLAGRVLVLEVKELRLDKTAQLPVLSEHSREKK